MRGGKRTNDALEARALRLEGARRAHALALERWEGEKGAHYAEQKEQQAGIDALRARYEAKDPEAIIDYCQMVLSESDFPDASPTTLNSTSIASPGSCW